MVPPTNKSSTNKVNTNTTVSKDTSNPPIPKPPQLINNSSTSSTSPNLHTTNALQTTNVANQQPNPQTQGSITDILNKLKAADELNLQLLDKIDSLHNLTKIRRNTIA